MPTTDRQPWSEFALLALAALAVLVSAAFSDALGAPEAWTLVAALGAAYGLSRGFARNRWNLRAARPAAAAVASTEEGPAVTLSAERLEVDRRRRPRERVTLRKEVVTDHVNVTIPVRREELRVIRTPIGDDEDVPVSEPAAGEVREVILMEERVVVDKRLVASERVRLETDVVTREEQIKETVRHEEVEIDRLPAGEPATEKTQEAP
jgi:uncharacterized protein (TIGR02271 family)